MNLLFLGGKRLLGNSLLNSFLNSKINKITVLYRSKKPDIKKKYKSKVEFIKCDRSNYKELKSKITKLDFQIIFDNNCYNIKNTLNIFRAMKNKKFYYFFTSSIITYFNFNKVRFEKDHNKFNHKLQINKDININMALNKRKIENYLIKKKTNFCILRMHNIIGKKDHSLKTSFLKNLTENVRDKFNLKNSDQIQYIYLRDGVKILKYLLNSCLSGRRLGSVYNIANDPVKVSSIVKLNKKNKNTVNFQNKEIIENLIVSNKKIKKYTGHKFTKLANLLKN